MNKKIVIFSLLPIICIHLSIFSMKEKNKRKINEKEIKKMLEKGLNEALKMKLETNELQPFREEKNKITTQYQEQEQLHNQASENINKIIKLTHEIQSKIDDFNTKLRVLKEKVLKEKSKKTRKKIKQEAILLLEKITELEKKQKKVSRLQKRTENMAEKYAKQNFNKLRKMIKNCKRFNKCQVCKKKRGDIPIKKCSRCQAVCYCSKECQLQDWPNHKQYCKKNTRLKKIILTEFDKL